MQNSNKYSYWQTHSQANTYAEDHSGVHQTDREKKLKYNPGSVFHQANKLANHSSTINSCSVSESKELIISELENPTEYAELAQPESIFCGVMKEILVRHKVSQEHIKTRNRALRVQLLKLLNYKIE